MTGFRHKLVLKQQVKDMWKKRFNYQKNYVRMLYGDITHFHIASIKKQVNVQNKYEMRMIGEFNDIS